MKKIALLTFAFALFSGVSSANAFSCASSSYGTACTSSLGTVAVTRDGAVAVGPHGDIHAYRNGDGFYAYHAGSSCYWHNGLQICR